ncbi:MAG: response regulator [Desulfobulbaceae bacterium]|nr:response regulator [Desulfobulbaceae bacterium]
MTKKKILLVDDEESIHILYREELEELGYEVHSAMSGEEAMRVLPSLRPNLIILDIQMPGMNGIDVLRRVKEQDPKLPVILSSAYQEFKQNLSSWASDDFVVKSADMRELVDSVRRHIGD